MKSETTIRQEVAELATRASIFAAQTVGADDLLESANYLMKVADWDLGEVDGALIELEMDADLVDATDIVADAQTAQADIRTFAGIADGPEDL